MNFLPRAPSTGHHVPSWTPQGHVLSPVPVTGGLQHPKPPLQSGTGEHTAARALLDPPKQGRRHFGGA